MARWNPNRNPSRYPIIFHQAIKEPGSQLIGSDLTKEKAVSLRKKFNAFAATLKTYPLHPTSQKLSQLGVELRIKIVPDLHTYSVWLTKRKKISSTLTILVDSLGKEI